MCIPTTIYSADEIIRQIKSRKENYWLKIRKNRTLFIFKWAAKNISAYKSFLKERDIDYNKIKNFNDFLSIPAISKNNYLKQYDIEKTSCYCFLSKPTVFTATSGSTGTPFYFPRDKKLDWQNSVINELFIRNGFKEESVPTLVIIGFGMGVWIGGLINYSAFDIVAKNGYPISIITPGINKQEIFNVLKNLSPHFKQTILTGYPPFVKDIIDESENYGIDLKKINLRLLFAAESFTENFRDYLVKKSGIKNLYLDTLNIYGSADIGAMAFETPLSILIRRLALKNKPLFREIFSDINKTPTLAQYIPHFINFEETSDKRVLLTGDSIVPLVRYDIGDRGGVFTLSEVKEKFKKHKIDLMKEAKKAGISRHIYELPFVYVYERTDFSVKLHLREIFPEIIRDALMHNILNQYLTGKFTIAIKYNNRSNQYLEINIEVIKDKIINKKLKKIIHKRVLEAMYLKSVGPGDPAEFIKKPNLIKLVFWPAEHPTYFKSGVKQKWVMKENLPGIKAERRVLKPRIHLPISRIGIKKAIMLTVLKNKIKVAV